MINFVFLTCFRRPGTCNGTETSKPERVAKMQVKPSKAIDPVQWCNDGTVAKAAHQFDPKLTVMLSSVSTGESGNQPVAFF